MSKENLRELLLEKAREHFGEEVVAPATITSEEAYLYSKPNCRKCHSKGYLDYDRPGEYPVRILCPCTEKRLNWTS